MANISGKSVLLIIGGGIAAYKSLELIRLLKAQGVSTTAIMTKRRAGIHHATFSWLAHRHEGAYGPVQPHRRNRDGAYRAFTLG